MDASNAVDGRRDAAALGKRLFNDVRFSRNQAVSCASCHALDKQFQDGLPLGRGVGVGTRRTMPIVGTGHSPWLFWDGRKDSLWSQALGPLEDAVEHGGNRTRYARTLQAHYRAGYEAVFGPMPDLTGLPSDAGPLGNAPERSAWESMTPESRNDVSRVFANMGKAIAWLNQALNAALDSDEVRARMRAQGALPGGGTPEQLARFAQAEYERNQKIVKSINIKD